MRMLLQIVVNGIISGSIYALTALGFSVVYRTVRFFHFAHGAVYTVGAYCAYILVTRAGFGIASALLVAMGVSACAGVAIDRAVYRPLRARSSSALAFLLASFGAFILIENAIGLLFGHAILTLNTRPVKTGYRFFSASITGTQILIIGVALGLMCLVWLFVQRTKLGKALRAVSDDSLGASVVGINPERTIILSFVIGSALAGAAGVLVSLEKSIEPTMGLSAALEGIVAAVIGGVGSIPGAVLGGYFLGLAENLGIWVIPAIWKDAIAYTILILFLLLRPGGILGIPPVREEL